MTKIKLAEIAQKMGKTKMDIARETGINRNTINALMKGRVKDVKFSTLEKICKTYGIKMSDILESVDFLEKGKAISGVIKLNRKLYKQEGEIIPFTCWPWALVAGTLNLGHDGRNQGLGQLDLYFKGDYGIVYWDFDSLKNFAALFYESHAEKEKYTKLYNKYLVYSSEIEDIYLKSQDTIPEKIDDLGIRSLFEKLLMAYKGFWECSLFIDAFDTGFDQEKINEVAKEFNFGKGEIEILTTPPEMTFADERKYALLSVIKNFLSSGRKASRERLGVLIEKNKSELGQYRKKFDYYKSNYAYIKHISSEEIESEIRKYLEDIKLLKAEYKKLDQYAKNKQVEVDIVLKNHRLKENPLWFFSQLTYWREHRKKINLMGIHVLDFVLSAVEEKTGIQKKYLHYLSFDEMDNVLKGLIPSATLERRYKDGILVTILGDGYKIFEGVEANSIKEDLEALLSGEARKIPILTGQTASQGYAKGVARIILTQEDFGKFIEGEVLVTSMTRPEFVPLMKKAVAIVTNEGGITCHAAIVSRELGKPCVIGTKNATQVIKDGDLVEVRANHGTVRVLK